MDYASVKHLHMAAVTLSALGFAARAVGALMGAPWVGTRLAKTLPHLVDTLLLASALVMLWLLQLNPLVTPWLLAKISGLLCYIALGMVTLRPRLALPLRAVAAVAALLVVAWIVSVAVSKNPWGFL